MRQLLRRPPIHGGASARDNTAMRGSIAVARTASPGYGIGPRERSRIDRTPPPRLAPGRHDGDRRRHRLRRRRRAVLGRRIRRRAPRHRCRTLARRPGVPPLRLGRTGCSCRSRSRRHRRLNGVGWARAITLTLFVGPIFSLISFAGFLLVPLGHGGVIQPSCAALGGLLLAALCCKEKIPRIRADRRRHHRRRASGDRRRSHRHHRRARLLGD